MIYFYIGLAGATGAILRYVLGMIIFPEAVFPFATLSLNLIGSFLLAWLTSRVFENCSLVNELKIVIGSGLIGSFTTFSALSVECVQLLEEGRWSLAFIYIVISVFGGLLMSSLGFRR